MKGSLQLSTNVMVTLILTIIIISIGFGIFFKIFHQVENINVDIDEQSQRQLSVLLKDSDYALSKTKIDVKRGDVGRVWLGIDNPSAGEITYSIDLNIKDIEGLDSNQVATERARSNEYYETLPSITVGSEETGFHLILITPPKNAPKSTYSLEVNINSESRTLFLQID